MKTKKEATDETLYLGELSEGKNNIQADGDCYSFTASVPPMLFRALSDRISELFK